MSGPLYPHFEKSWHWSASNPFPLTTTNGSCVAEAGTELKIKVTPIANMNNAVVCQLLIFISYPLFFAAGNRPGIKYLTLPNVMENIDYPIYRLRNDSIAIISDCNNI